MRAPVAATPSGVIALTVAVVPSGMKTGVSITPCAVVSRPSRAAPSRARISKPMPVTPVILASGELRHHGGEIVDAGLVNTVIRKAPALPPRLQFLDDL